MKKQQQHNGAAPINPARIEQLENMALELGRLGLRRPWQKESADWPATVAAARALPSYQPDAADLWLASRQRAQAANRDQQHGN